MDLDLSIVFTEVGFGCRVDTFEEGNMMLLENTDELLEILLTKEEDR